MAMKIISIFDEILRNITYLLTDLSPTFDHKEKNVDTTWKKNGHFK